MSQLSEFLQTKQGKLIAAALGLALLFTLCLCGGGLFLFMINTSAPTPSPELAAVSPTPLPPPTDTPTATPSPTLTDTPLPTPTATPVVVETGTPTPPPSISDLLSQTEATPAGTETVSPDGTGEPAEPDFTGQIRILTVNKVAQFADIQNFSDAPIDLDGWVLRSEAGEQDCPLEGVIEPDQILRIWASTQEVETDGYGCGFEEPIWNNAARDPAVLLSPGGAEVARFE